MVHGGAAATNLDALSTLDAKAQPPYDGVASAALHQDTSLQAGEKLECVA
jgi:hypothetical protein